MNEWKIGRWGWEKIREERRKCGRCRRGGKGGGGRGAGLWGCMWIGVWMEMEMGMRNEE